MKTVRLLVYTHDKPQPQHLFHQADGFHQWVAGSTLRIITLRRGGWLRAIWEAWRA